MHGRLSVPIGQPMLLAERSLVNVGRQQASNKETRSAFGERAREMNLSLAIWRDFKMTTSIPHHDTCCHRPDSTIPSEEADSTIASDAKKGFRSAWLTWRGRGA